MRCLAPLILLAALLAFQNAQAADKVEKPDAAQAAASEAPKNSEAAKKPATGKVEDAAPTNVRMDQVEIRGEFENPDVFYIIPRRKAEMDTGSLSMDYTEGIMAPMIEHVFTAQHAKEAKGGAGD